MKRTKDNNAFGLFRLRSFKYDLLAMISRNRGHSLVGIIIRLLPTMKGQPSPTICRGIISFCRSISQIARKQGAYGLALYLKSMSVLIQQSIAGHYGSVLTPRIGRTNSGLPRILPVGFRKFCRLGNRFYIRLGLTFASLYRDVQAPGRLKLSSITKPFSGDLNSVNAVIGFIPSFVDKFCPLRDRNREFITGKFSYIPLLTSSPQSTLKNRGMTTSIPASSPLSLMRSALCLTPGQIFDLEQLFNISIKPASARFGKILTDPLARLGLARRAAVGLRGAFAPPHRFTGKLGLKLEAAGKVRVFAMVDPWTQLAMYPIHKGLFEILSRFPTIDGTFNQLKPLERAFRGNPLYSMDLSSATDRLPISIQKPLLQQIFNLSPVEADAWERLMVDRDYMVPKSLLTKDLPPFVRYSVGQPMGALSSWAMLAMTHHLIIQFAAHLVSPSPDLFSDYAVLGDDVVIYNSQVAKMYHRIIQGLGVECNLAKSVLSPKGIGLEFAKKTFYLGHNVSPSPLKEFVAALEDIISFASYCKKYGLSLSNAVKVAGFGYRVVGGVNRPLHKLNLKVRYLFLLLGLTGDQIALSFNSLRRHLHGEYFIRQYLKFLYDQYLRVLKRVDIGLKKAKDFDFDNPGNGLVRAWKSGHGGVSDSCIEALSHLALPFNLGLHKRFVRNANLCWEEGKSRLPDLRYVMIRPFEEIRANLPVIYAELKFIINLESKFSRFQLSDLTVRSELSINKRPGEPKIFRYHQAFKTLSNELRKSPLFDRLRSSQPPVDNSPKLGGPLILAVIPLLKRLSATPLRFVIRRALTRRLRWFGFLSALVGLSSQIWDFKEVVTCGSTIAGALVTLLKSLPSTLNGNDYSLIILGVGFFTLHLIELYGVLIMAVCTYNYQFTFEFMHMMATNYWLGDITLYQYATHMLWFGHTLLYETVQGIVPLMSSYLANCGVYAIPIGFLFGMSITQLILCLIGFLW